MSLAGALRLGLEIVLLLVRHRLNPQLAYAEAIEKLTLAWREDVDEFAEAARTHQVDRVAALLADLERRRLQHHITGDADGD